MAVTLNYTSKGLIHAIRTQLEQQKKDGRITGDTSYKSITTCDFWSTIKDINDKHDKKNKVFHGKSYGCDSKNQNTDWTKTIVVYGSTTFTDEEWEMLLNSMGLQLNKQEESKAEEPVQPKAEEKVIPAAKEEQPVQTVTPKEEQPAPVKDKKEEFAMPIATMAALMQTLEDSGYKDIVTASDVIQTKLKCNVVLTKDKELKIFNADKENPKELTKKDENGNTILSQELRQALDEQLLKEASQKAEAEKQTETSTNTESATDTEAEECIEEDDENCTDDEE